MNEKNIYDFLESQGFEKSNRGIPDYQSREFDLEEYKKRKSEEKQFVYDLIDAGTDKMRESSDALKKYLFMQQHFDRYTVNNVIAIMEQKANATQLVDREKMKAQNARPRKGASHIKILEPYNYVTPDGHKGIGYNVKKVFDVSETTARSTVRFKRVQDTRMLLKALVYKPQVAMEVIDDVGNYDKGALFDPESNTIFIKRGLSQEDFFRDVARELAYADFAAEYPDLTRGDMSFHAECTAYMLCQKYGIEPERVELVMPERLLQMESKDLRGELSMMRKTMLAINDRMGQSLEYQRQEKAKAAREDMGVMR